MAERGAIFNADMVRAFQRGAKTQTRRPVTGDHGGPTAWVERDGLWHPCADVLCRGTLDAVGPGIKSPLGAPGDLLCVVTIKQIHGHENYGAGDDGRIYRIDLREPRPLRVSLSAGYERVTLGMGHKRLQKSELVHALICAAFYGCRPSPRHEARHLDGDRRNNRPENLDWGTPEQNWADRMAHNRGVRERHHNAKLTMEIARAMRNSGRTAGALAKEYGVSSKTVSNVLSGRTWSEISAPPPPNVARWHARLWLEITGVRVERVANITEEDARAEGVEPTGSLGKFTPHVSGFRELWTSIYGTASWDRSDWVWVYDLRCVDRSAVAA